jgi:hypothetical protein
MHLTSCCFRPIACAFTVSVAAATLKAQSVRFSVGAGAIVPTSVYGTHDNWGMHVLGAAVVPSPVANLFFRLDGMYSATTHQYGELGHTKIAGGSASLLWRLRSASPNLHPYLLAGIGSYHETETDIAPACNSAYCASSFSQSAHAWSGGGGLELLQSGPAIGWFIEARYVTIQSGTPTNLFLMTLGLVFGTR